MTRLEVLSRLSGEEIQIVRLCEICIEDQLLSRREFGELLTFECIENQMQDLLELVVEKHFKWRGRDLATRALRKRYLIR